MANKRPNNEPSGSGEPPTKKKMLTTFEPVQLGPIYNLVSVACQNVLHVFDIVIFFNIFRTLASK